MRVLVPVLLLLFWGFVVDAQTVTGIIKDRSSNLKLEDVNVLNQSTGEKAQTLIMGTFKIAASINQVLVFYKPGYRPDTLLLTDLKPIIRYLTLENRLLNTVVIKGELFNPAVQYAPWRTSIAFTSRITTPACKLD